MAGHSKWANIKFRKAGQDAKRGKLFTKFIREITIAARTGGDDVSSNPRLRAAIDKALSGNMTRDTIERAIKRGAGGQEGQDLEEIVYEGYGPAGVAVLVYCLTNNRNRTVGEVRHAFTKHNGNLGTSGSVNYMFSNQGQIVLSKDTDEEKAMEISIENGADDVTKLDDGLIEIKVEPSEYLNLKDKLIENKFTIEFSEVAMVPENYVDLDKDGTEKVIKLIDRLEELDDVQNVYTNANFSD